MVSEPKVFLQWGNACCVSDRQPGILHRQCEHWRIYFEAPGPVLPRHFSLHDAAPGHCNPCICTEQRQIFSINLWAPFAQLSMLNHAVLPPNSWEVWGLMSVFGVVWCARPNRTQVVPVPLKPTREFQKGVPTKKWFQERPSDSSSI